MGMRAAAWVGLVAVLVGGAGEANADGRDLVSPNPARVVTATFLGGEGTEWLSAGAFLPDGTVLVCGVTLDAEVTLGGVKAEALGRDAPGLPRVRSWRRLGEKDTGRTAVPELEIGGLNEPSPYDDFSLEPPPTEEELKRREKEDLEALRSWPRQLQWGEEGESVASRTMYRKLTWLDPEATGFLAVCTPDLKQVLRLRRLPRGAGSITSAAVAADGAVYIAGAATGRIARLSDRRLTETVPDPKGVSEDTFGCRRTYLARLGPDCTRVEWVRDLEGWSIAPRLRVLDDGTVSMHGPGLRTYTPAGELVRAVSIENTRVLGGLDVSPVDGCFTRVGDWMSGTGREPYRNPRLYVYNPDGSTRKHLYGWRGPFVGVDALRLVADSAVRRSAYDPAGDLVIGTWSHGGNNVFFRYPYDIERYVENRLDHRPMHTCASIVKMDRDHNVLAATRWINSSFIRDLVCAADGSVALVGATGSSVRTPNAVSDRRGGRGVYVIDPDLTAYRFASIVPACGSRVTVSGCYDRPNGWGFATGVSMGRPMLLWLTGASESERDRGETVTPPLERPVQASFGGGLMDGYALLLDLTATKPWPEYVEPERPPREPRPYEGPLAWPADGQVFTMGTERYVTVKATFRDQKDAMWPSFYQGRAAAGGRFTYGTRGAEADFVLDCPTVLQEEGLQHQRVCGELVSFTVTEVTDAKGRPRQRAVLDKPVKLAVSEVGPWEPADRPAGYGRVMCPVARARLGGALHVGPQAVPIGDAECRAQFVIPKNVDPSKPGTRPNKALLVIRFTVPGRSIGLTGDLAGQSVRVQFTCSASSAVDYSAQEERVELPDLDVPPEGPGRLFP